MLTATIAIQAIDEADLANRLAGITDQINQGYSGAQGKTAAGIFKYLVKETVKGSLVQLPRIQESETPLSEGADEQPTAADESDTDDQDTAGAPAVRAISLGLPAAPVAAAPVAVTPTLAIAA